MAPLALSRRPHIIIDSRWNNPRLVPMGASLTTALKSADIRYSNADIGRPPAVVLVNHLYWQVRPMSSFFREWAGDGHPTPVAKSRERRPPCRHPERARRPALPRLGCPFLAAS